MIGWYYMDDFTIFFQPVCLIKRDYKTFNGIEKG